MNQATRQEWNWKTGWVMPACAAILLLSLLLAGWSARETIGDMHRELRLETTLIADTIHRRHVLEIIQCRFAEDSAVNQRMRIGGRFLRSLDPRWTSFCFTGRFEDGSPYHVDDLGRALPANQIPLACLEAFDRKEIMVRAGFLNTLRHQTGSVYYPLLDTIDGRQLTVLGVTFDTTAWRAPLLFSIVGPLLPGLLLMVLLWTSLRMLNHCVRREQWKKQLSVITGSVIMAGLIITGFITFFIYLGENRAQHEMFVQLANSKTFAVVNTIRTIRDVEVEGLVRFFEGSDEVSREEFATYAHHLTADGAIWTWGWAPVVQQADRSAFEQRIRQQLSLPNFRIWQRDEHHQPASAGDRETYYPVLYVIPALTNSAMYGYDLGSEPNRRKAVEGALKSGLLTASDPVPLNIGTNTSIGIIAVRPVYSPNQPGKTRGLIAVAIHSDAFLNAHLKDMPDPELSETIHLTLHQMRINEPPIPLAASAPPLLPYPAGKSRSLTMIRPISAFGQIYAITARPTPAFFSIYRIQSTWIMLPAGLLMTAACTLAIRTAFRRREELELLVEERTERLRESEEKYRLMAENSTDIIWQVDPDYHFTYISPADEKIRGVPQSEVLGRHFQTVLSPHGLELAQELNAKLKEDERNGLFAPVLTYELEQIRRDGRCFWTEVTAVRLYDKKGNLVGYQGITRDISMRKMQEQCNRLTIAATDILNSTQNLREAIEQITQQIRHDTACDAVGIRLQQGEDFPYVVQSGFSKEFLSTENSLLVHGSGRDVCRNSDGSPCLECTCGLVLSGKTDPSNPLFTPGGSCWTNDSFPLLELPAPQDPRLNPRNNCIHFGYASVALIPIREKQKIIGLLQLNSQHKDHFTLELIQAFEEIANHIGEALARKQAEQELLESEERYRLLVETAQEGIIVLQNNRLAYANPMALRIAGYPQDQLLNREFIHLVHPEDREHVIENYKRRMAGESVEQHYYFRILRGDSSVAWLEISGVRFHWNGSPAILNFISDVSRQKAADEALQDSNRQLQEAIEHAREMTLRAETANRAKSEFIANISHEIRTPMNAIIGFADLLTASLKDERQRQHAAVIIQSGKSLLRLINDILDLSKIEAGKMDIQPAPFSLTRLLEEIHALFVHKAKEKGLSLEICLPSETPETVILDSARLRQVLLNLLGNAIKFTETGGVVLQLECTYPYDNKNLADIRLSVTDTGIGVPDLFKPLIFDPFEQQPGQDHAKYGGTGLGLAISMRLVTIMGGRLTLADNPTGQGAVFTIFFSGVSTTEQNEPLPAADMADRVAFTLTPTLLIVDNLPPDRHLLRSYLEPYGFTLLEAASEAEAADLIRRYAPSLVIANINLSRHHESSLLQIVRNADNQQGSPIPFIAVTASAMNHELDACYAAYDAVLVKPFLKEDLICTIARFVPHTVNAAPAQTVKAREPPIIIEENITDADALLSRLSAFFPEPLTTIRRTLRINQAKPLAADIHAIASEFHAVRLVHFCDELLSAIGSFQIDRMKAILLQIEIYIRRLREARPPSSPAKSP